MDNFLIRGRAKLRVLFGTIMDTVLTDVLITDYYNSSWKSPILAPAVLWPTFMFIWLSMIWNNSPGWGILPDSILDQTGMLFRLISKAPVLMSWVSTALQRKKVIMQAYILFSNIQAAQAGVSMK